MIAPKNSASLTSSISPSTIITLSRVAPTIMSISAFSFCEKVGFTTNFPSMRETRASDIGPLKGISETAKAAEAAKPANASGISSPSEEYSVTFTKTSA